jgi:hypothetical protein
VKQDIVEVDQRSIEVGQRQFSIEIFSYPNETQKLCFRIRENDAVFTFDTVGGSSSEFCDHQMTAVDLFELAENHLRATVAKMDSEHG